VLVGELDYENTTTYSLFVEVVDEHQEKSALDIKLTVTDVNEAPISIVYKALAPVKEDRSRGYLVGSIVVSYW